MQSVPFLLVNQFMGALGMKENNMAIGLYMPRELADRRVATNKQLPFMTEEGLIMFDRREGVDRRLAPREQANFNSILPQVDSAKFAL
jgi:hypothetical protein